MYSYHSVGQPLHSIASDFKYDSKNILFSHKEEGCYNLESKEVTIEQMHVWDKIQGHNPPTFTRKSD